MTPILVEARSYAFGLLPGERGTLDADDPEVVRGLVVGHILGVDANGELLAAPDPNAGRPCGCGGR